MEAIALPAPDDNAGNCESGTANMENGPSCHDEFERGGESRSESKSPVLIPGEGALLSDLHHRRRDALLIGKAAKRNWPVNGYKRRKVIDRLMQLVEYGDASEAIAAARAVIACDQINVMRDKAPTVSQTVNLTQVNIAGQLPPDAQQALADADRLLDGLSAT